MRPTGGVLSCTPTGWICSNQANLEIQLNIGNSWGGWWLKNTARHLWKKFRWKYAADKGVNQREQQINVSSIQYDSWCIYLNTIVRHLPRVAALCQWKTIEIPCMNPQRIMNPPPEWGGEIKHGYYSGLLHHFAILSLARQRCYPWRGHTAIS